MPGMADAALLSLNFFAGVLAFFSPCGFPMLPAYLAYYLPRGDEAPESVKRAVARGMLGGGMAAAGALALLALVGVGAYWLGAPFRERVLLMELVGGLVVLTLGVLVLLGRGPRFSVGMRPSHARGALGLFMFGALYAGVAAGCVAPVFLTVVFSAFAAPTGAEAALLLGAYAAGLATLLVAVTVLVTTAQHQVLAALKRALPRVERVSGAVLVAVGLYLVLYWARFGTL